MMAPKFSEYQAWLASDEYVSQMKRLIGEPSAAPREEWPLNIGEVIAQHEARATMCLEAAARHMRKANSLATMGDA
jgi:hypothetical protein